MYKSNPHVWNEGPRLVFMHQNTNVFMRDLGTPEHKCTNLTHTFGMRDLG